MAGPVHTHTLDAAAIDEAARLLEGVILHTPLMESHRLSTSCQASVYLKREDLQVVRSYKIRGAYHKMACLSENELQHGVVCASAGNHAQGVAMACARMAVHGTIFMPVPTPDQKIRQVKMFGQDKVEVRLVGDTFDDAYAEARRFQDANRAVFIHPFDDLQIIAGQGTVGKEILEDMTETPDYLILPIGGGGLSAGVATYVRAHSPGTKIIGVEPAGAPAMKTSLEKGEVVTLEKIDKFVDGAAVRRVGQLTFDICRRLLDDVVLVPEGRVCSEILRLYNEDAIVVEPAGALSIAALDMLRDEIRGKKVVCVVSGSNNDITRTAEIKERSLLYEGLKHYFIINFPQRAGALREFLIEVLGPEDDISHFEYSKKNSRERGPALIGIELRHYEDLQPLIDRMEKKKIRYEYLNDQPQIFHYVI